MDNYENTSDKWAKMKDKSSEIELDGHCKHVNSEIQHAYLEDFYYMPTSIDEVSFFMVLFRSLLSHWKYFFGSLKLMVIREEVPILIKHLLS